MQNFWQKLNILRQAQGKPFTILAPMANVTDWAFRQIIIETGRPDIFFTEFISCDGICAIGAEKFKSELFFTENERPIVVQFFTANPEKMYQCAQLAQKLGFDGIDINMGCPDRSVEKQGAGAALIKNPKIARKIIKEAIRGAGHLPVSVKTRLGFNAVDYDWLKLLLDTGITALSIHGRTRKEMSKVPARWDEIGNLAKIANDFGNPSSISKRLSARPLIIGNGDVKNMDDAFKKTKEYNIDGIMIGRGIFDNPWFFSDITTAKQQNRLPKQRIELLKKHIVNYEKLWGQNKRFDYMKRFFKIYISGFDGAKELRLKLMEAKSINDAGKLLISSQLRP